jgi:hypothetical protein
MSDDRIKVWVANISGGRPMQFIKYHFTDSVSGRDVNLYRDKFGKIWMAENRWGLFRVLADQLHTWT